jgi:hypothetical protein
MTTAQPLQDLEALPHQARVRRVVQVGQAAARGESTALAALADLETGGWYERSLASAACRGRQDAAPASRLLKEPSRALRRAALALVARFGDDVWCPPKRRHPR